MTSLRTLVVRTSKNFRSTAPEFQEDVSKVLVERSLITASMGFLLTSKRMTDLMRVACECCIGEGAKKKAEWFHTTYPSCC